MRRIKGALKRVPGMIWGSLLIILLFIIFADNFAKMQNIDNILKSTAILIVISIGMTMAILSQKIDLSIGGIMSFTGMVAALYIKPLSDAGMLTSGNILIVILIGMGIGLLFGAFNGLMIGVFKFNYWLITFSTMSIAYGLSEAITAGQIVAGYDKFFRSWVNDTPILGRPNIVWIALLIAIVFWAVLRYTRFGMHVYAVGDSEQCAQQSGINVKRVRFAIYAISGALAGFGGVLLIAKTNSASPTIGNGYEWDAIAACVVGGTSMEGGKGGLWGTVFGALIIAAVKSGLQLLGLNNYWQQLFVGLFILCVIVVDVLGARRKRLQATRRIYKS